MRWDRNGERIASTSSDGTAEVLDFASGKVSYTERTVDQSKSFVICLITNLFTNLLTRTGHVNMFSLKKAAKNIIMTI